VTLATYANALTAGFQFDDYNVIVNNPAVHGLGAWLHSMPGIRPLLKLSYSLNWIVGGAVVFHLVNVLLHALNAVLLYLIGIELGRPRAAGVAEPPSSAAQTVAAVTAMVFALHPAQTEAVTYVCGRSVSLMAAFYLAATFAWLHGRHVLSAVLFAAALASKETAWTLPIALLLLASVMGVPWREALRGLRLHWAVLAAFAGAVILVPGYRTLLLSSIRIRTLGENLLAQIEGVWYLVTQPLLLLRTDIDPDLAAPLAITPELALKAAVLLGLLATGVVCLRSKPWVGAALLWMFLHLLPTNSLLPRIDLANDRQLYLALIGPAALLAGALLRLPGQSVATLAIAALCLGLGAKTVARNRDYRDEISLWRATVASSPNKARPWNNLGYAYYLAGDAQAARRAYLKALEVEPSNVRARFNLRLLDP